MANLIKAFSVCFVILFYSCIHSPGGNTELIQPSPQETSLNNEEKENTPIETSSNDRKNENPEETKQPAFDALNESPPDRLIKKENTPGLKIKPFNAAKAQKEILSAFDENEYPVVKNEEILFTTHDLDSDGIQEIFVPGIETNDPEQALFEYLSDVSRNYNGEKANIPFFFHIFTEKEGTYRRTEKISLGEHNVFKAFSKLYGNPDLNRPLIFSINFQMREGTFYQWIIFNPPELLPTQVFKFANTMHKETVISDIDSDQMIDIIVYEKNMEEKRGVETYLFWKKWNGQEFQDYKYTNIVRNLNNFLLTVKNAMIHGEIEELISYAIADEKLETEAHPDIRALLMEYLGLPVFESEDEGFVLGGIQDVIFPDILDNPFYLKDPRGAYFPLNYRIVYEGNISIIADAYLYMLNNPFGERQFTFLKKISSVE